MIRQGHVTIGGRPRRYLEAGAGWPVVLLHAFPLNADMWRPQLDRVPEGWRLIAPDLRGFGPDTNLAGGARAPTMDEIAEDVGVLLDELRIDPAVIGGLSMGGYVAFALFRMAPERFSGMILSDTKPQADTPEGRQRRRQMIEVARAGGALAVANQMLPTLLGETTMRTRPEVQSQVRGMIQSASVAAISDALEAMMERPDSTRDLARISCPVLVLAGDEDMLTPVAHAEAMQQRITRCRLVVLPGAGHLSNLETPDTFSQAVSDFLVSHI